MNEEKDLYKEELKLCPQRQDSLTDQMNTVIDLARQYGCYDAQDWIKKLWEGRKV